MRLLKNGSVRVCAALPLVVAWLVCFSCSTPPVDFKLETSSPDGQYRVKLEGRGEPPNAGVGEFQRQIATLEAARNAQVVAADGAFFREDSLDSYFLQRFPLHEWVNNSVLRFGDAASRDRFRDLLIVTNRTGKQFDLVILRYGKYEMFFIYDFPPAKRLELNASPQLETETVASSVYYQAYLKGVYQPGNVTGPPRDKESATPLTLTVDIVDQ